MNKENQPKVSGIENPIKYAWQKFSSARWRTKALIIGGLGLVVAAA